MSAIITPAPQPARDDSLMEILSRGGAASVRVIAAVPGVYFLVPQDERRTYIGFSLPDTTDTLTICPGEDAVPAGFTLHANESIMEFAGSLVAKLVKGCWRLNADVAGTIDVTVVRD